MFTSVCTTSSYWRMLKEGGEKREKKSSWKSQGTVGTIICFVGFTAVQKQMQLPPLHPSRETGEQADHAESPKQEETSTPLRASGTQERHPQRNQTHHITHSEQKSRTGFKRALGQAQSKQPHSLFYSTYALSSLEGEEAHRKGDSSSGLTAQPPVKDGQPLWHPKEPAAIPTWILLL